MRCKHQVWVVMHQVLCVVLLCVLAACTRHFSDTSLLRMHEPPFGRAALGRKRLVC